MQLTLRLRAEFGFGGIRGTVLIWGPEARPLPAAGGGLGARPGDDGGRGGGTPAEAPAAPRGPGSGAGLLLGLGLRLLRAGARPGLPGPVGAGRPERTGRPGVALLAPGQAGSLRGRPQGRGAAFGAQRPARHLGDRKNVVLGRGFKLECVKPHN